MNFKDMFYNMSLIGVIFVYGIILTFIISLISSYPVMFAWNYVIPYLFGLPTLNFWRSFCLIWILCSLWKITPIPYQTKPYKTK